MNFLQLNIDVIPDIGSNITVGFARPAHISLHLCAGRAELIREIVNVNWDADVLLNWLNENKISLLEEAPPHDLSGGGSIAARIQVFYNNVDPDDVDALERVFGYRVSHGLRFAFRGVDVPNVYLGRNENRYELSCAEGDEPWAYQFDLPAFLMDVARIARG